MKSLQMMHSVELNTSSYSNGNKEVEFVEMIHFGKPAFYENVSKEVREKKSKGYILFYGSVIKNEVSDTLKLKLRKMIGFLSFKRNL